MEYCWSSGRGKRKVGRATQWLLLNKVAHAISLLWSKQVYGKPWVNGVEIYNFHVGKGSKYFLIIIQFTWGFIFLSYKTSTEIGIPALVWRLPRSLRMKGLPALSSLAHSFHARWLPVPQPSCSTIPSRKKKEGRTSKKDSTLNWEPPLQNLHRSLPQCWVLYHLLSPTAKEARKCSLLVGHLIALKKLWVRKEEKKSFYSVCYSML